MPTPCPALPLVLPEIGAVQVLEKPLPSYDKSGEQHFNLISALHKAWEKLKKSARVQP